MKADFEGMRACLQACKHARLQAPHYEHCHLVALSQSQILNYYLCGKSCGAKLAPINTGQPVAACVLGTILGCASCASPQDVDCESGTRQFLQFTHALWEWEWASSFASQNICDCRQSDCLAYHLSTSKGLSACQRRLAHLSACSNGRA